jgi:uncharacterized protein (DUF2461 family)
LSKAKKKTCFYNSIETRGIFTRVAWVAREFNLKDKIQTIFNIKKSWKTFENAEERQRFANLESEDLKHKV